MVNKDAVVREFTELVKNHYGSRLAKIILYGSYARGDENEESDIDFLVLLRDEEIRVGHEISSISHLMSRLGLAQNIWISAQPLSVSKFLKMNQPFFVNVKQEGVVVYE